MLRLPAAVRDQLAAWIRAGYPHETCGLLIGQPEGRPGAERGPVVESATQARNLNTERAADRFELDPDDWVAADFEARDAGREIVGIWHSHPDHPARPSATDQAWAHRGYAYVIVAVTAQGIQDVRSWRLTETEAPPGPDDEPGERVNGFIEEEIQS